MSSTDTFDDRSLTGGWGETSSGRLVWQTDPYMPPANLAAYHVENGYGQFDPELSRGGPVPGDATDGLIGFLADPDIAALNGAMEVRAIISLADTTTEGDYTAEPQFYLASSVGFGNYEEWHGLDYYHDGVDSYIAAGAYGAGAPGPDFVSIPAYAPGTMLNIHVKWHTDGLVEASLWPVGQTEPSTWMVSAGGGWTPFATIDTFYIFIPNIGQSVRVHDFAIVELPGATFSPNADWGAIATGWGS